MRRNASAATAPPVTPQKPENGRRNIFPPTPPETPESKLEYHGGGIPFFNLTPPVTPEKKCKEPEERNTFPLTPPKTPERVEKEAFLLSPALTPPKTQERSKKPKKCRYPTPDSLPAGYSGKPDRELTAENLRKNNIEISFEPNSSRWPKHVSELRSYLLANLTHDEVS